jgi:hypothetical protein
MGVLVGLGCSTVRQAKCQVGLSGRRKTNGRTATGTSTSRNHQHNRQSNHNTHRP